MTAQSFTLDRVFFDLSDRVKVRVGGSDRLRFLNGQLTNDVRKATNPSAIEACVLNAKGKMDAHVFVAAEPEQFILDASSELRETLVARLERYIIADDVQVDDVSDQLSIFHVLHSNAPRLGQEFRIRSANRFALHGWDIWAESSRRDQLSRQLSEQFTFCDADCAEVVRIEQGIPRWGRELTNEIIPVEANLEERCIDYEKGCYIGQETISRMKMSGQRNKKLCGLISVDASRLISGTRLVAGEERKEAGWITSAARSARLGKEIALGYVKRGFNSAGSRLEGTNPNDPAVIARVEIVDLPFAQ